jgi:hypothetical protein
MTTHRIDLAVSTRLPMAVPPHIASSTPVAASDE